jgi:hypothetical protein
MWRRHGSSSGAADGSIVPSTSSQIEVGASSAMLTARPSITSGVGGIGHFIESLGMADCCASFIFDSDTESGCGKRKRSFDVPPDGRISKDLE